MDTPHQKRETCSFLYSRQEPARHIIHFMFLASWYRHKADQCARMAKDATDPLRRASYKEEQKMWLVILAEYLEAERRRWILLANVRP